MYHLFGRSWRNTMLYCIGTLHTHRWDQFASEFTSLIFKGNFVDLFSGRFKMGRKPSQIVLNGRKSFKSMETSLFFFHPKKWWNLFHPIRKLLLGLCWFVPKTVAFFSSGTVAGDQQGGAPQKYHSSCLNLEVVLVITPGLPIYNLGHFKG